MRSIKHLRKPAIGGSLLSMGLVLLLLAMTVVGLNTQQTLTRQIRRQVHIRERSRDLLRSVGQLDLLHVRYQSTGMTLFRIGCDQITDSVNTQLKDLQKLLKNDPYRMSQLQWIITSIDTVQRYWQSISSLPGAKNPAQIALEEEKRLDIVRSAAADFEELSRSQLKNLQQREDMLMIQMRAWLILLEILIAVILLVISLRSGLTRIKTSDAADHGSATS